MAAICRHTTPEQEIGGLDWVNEAAINIHQNGYSVCALISLILHCISVNKGLQGESEMYFIG